jgi:cytochrome P450
MLTLFSHETTSSAFTWATHLLATHPTVQTRLRIEVRAALPTTSRSDSELTTVLESLPLLNAVCNETLRLYPTVPLTFRNARIDTTIDNVFIPQGTQLILVPWATNRLPQLWGPDADKFVPERWIDETGKPNNSGGSTSNYDTLTFLHGPRSCIGKDFAKAELRCLIAAFVAAFEMEMADPNYVAIPHGVVTIKPMGGMPLRLKVVK